MSHCCGSADNHQTYHPKPVLRKEGEGSRRGMSFLERMRGFFGLAKVAEDPVCGMKVSVAQAKKDGLVKRKGGKTYYFCSADCRDRF